LAPRPSASMSRKGNVKLDILEYGYESFQIHCASCHRNYLPEVPTDRAWHPSSIGLSLYQSLTDRQRYSIQQYLMAVKDARFDPNFGSLKDAH
jgi:hypothetical protein